MTELHPISSFADDPSQVGRELKPCLDQAKDTVPKHKHSSTPIFLGATAGMRFLQYVQSYILSTHFIVIFCEVRASA